MIGRFVSLEGGEGAGKSTQARRIADILERRGLRVVLTREPGGTEGSEAIRTLLMQGDERRWSARAETLLFAAARADHVEKAIRPALAAGAWVICDRFVDSTRAYQGASGMDDADIVALHAFGSGGLLPDRTIILSIAPDTGVARATRRDGERSDRFTARDPDFHGRVADLFDRLAAQDPTRIRRVRGDAAPERVTESIMGELADLLP